MINEGLEKRLNNEYKNISPALGDYIVFLKDKRLLMNDDNLLPIYKEEFNKYKFYYLFSMDEIKFFYCTEEIEEYDGYKYRFMSRKLPFKERWMNYATSLAEDFSIWFKENKYCGQCGKLNKYSDIERKLYCDDCNTMIFPRINPAVIVAVIDRDKDKIVVTKRSLNAVRPSLVSGYVETGESVEETCHREVMEEVGVKIKNIRYYKSQPWPFTQSLLFGFVADLDGSDKLTVDYNENVDAYWMSKEDVGVIDNNFSLTRELLDEFAKGNL